LAATEEPNKHTMEMGVMEERTASQVSAFWEPSVIMRLVLSYVVAGHRVWQVRSHHSA